MRRSETGNDEEERSHDECPAHETILAANLLNEEEQEEEAGHNLDDAEKAAEEQRIFPCADSIEYLGRDLIGQFYVC